MGQRSNQTVPPRRRRRRTLRDQHNSPDGDGGAGYGEGARDASVHENEERPEYRLTFVPRVEIEAALPDERLADVIDTLGRSARTGTIDEGKIIVSALECAVRIRTGATGETAL